MATPIAAIHPELFHYTGIRGLEGIIKSETLWATHFAFFSDTAEIRTFQARLTDILRPEVAKGIENLVRRLPDIQGFVEKQGGQAKVIKNSLNAITGSMYRVMLGTESTEAFVEPYITSFCTAATEDIAQQGLLSQWRGYGQEGGYAIVIDTSRLEFLLQEENNKWKYYISGGDVIYSSDTETKFREEFGEDIDALAASIAKWLNSAMSDPTPLENTYYPLIRCACRYKHGGFHEEREVRIVAIPHNRELFAEAKKRGLVEARKPRRVFFRSGTAVPFIDLFEGITHLPEKPLPITRIIVGPHRDKDKRRRAVEILLDQHGLKIPVSVSGIPYVGHTAN